MSSHKNCNAKLDKASDDDYICNPDTGNWVIKSGKIGKELIEKYGESFFGLVQKNSPSSKSKLLKSPKVKTPSESLAEKLYEGTTPFGAPYPFHPLGQIAMMLSLKELGALCKTSKSINQLCQNEDFWHLRYIQDFNPYLGQFDPYPGDPKQRTLAPVGGVKSWKKLYKLRSMYYKAPDFPHNEATMYHDPISGDYLFKGNIPDSKDSNPGQLRSCLLNPNKAREGQARPLSMNEVKSLVRHYSIAKAGHKKAEKCKSLFTYFQKNGKKFHPASEKQTRQ